MVSLQQLKAEGLIPIIPQGAGVPVPFSGYAVNCWDGIGATDVTLTERKFFPPKIFTIFICRLNLKKMKILNG